MMVHYLFTMFNDMFKALFIPSRCDQTFAIL